MVQVPERPLYFLLMRYLHVYIGQAGFLKLELLVTRHSVYIGQAGFLKLELLVTRHSVYVVCMFSL